VSEEEDEIALGEEIIAELRENEGKSLRALLKALRDGGDQDLYEKLIRHPRLTDLVPH
jgi:hypothetical protein